MTKTKRVTARVSEEMQQKIAMWAVKLGLTQAQLMGMAIQAGLDSIIRAVSPVDAMSTQQWAAIMKALAEQGLSLEGARIGSEELPGEKDKA